MESLDCIVVGAGVVGLACARALAQAGREVLIVESADRFGSGISSRNSEVIHAGLYYPAGSLKAALCVRGGRLLYAYCDEHHVPHRRCGKLVVAATAGQMDALRALAVRGAANGVDDLQLLSGAEARALEPALACSGALLSPSTGIVDSHALMLALLGDAEHAGAVLVTHTPALRGRVAPDGRSLILELGGPSPTTVRANAVVNAAGLGANALAAAIRGLPASAQPALRMAKGSYFRLQGRAPFSHLIYPLPEAAGLGVHLTLDLGGQARFGPDVEWLDETQAVDYAVDPRRADAFYGAIREYWPALPDATLTPDMAGIRPKLGGPGEAAADFRIDGAEAHGVDGLVNLFGIESPGLTSCLAIAEQVATRLGH